MCKSVICAMKCIILSIIIGMIFGAMCCCKIKNNKKMQRKANKALNAVEDFMEDMPQIFKHQK